MKNRNKMISMSEEQFKHVLDKIDKRNDLITGLRNLLVEMLEEQEMPIPPLPEEIVDENGDVDLNADEDTQFFEKAL